MPLSQRNRPSSPTPCELVQWGKQCVKGSFQQRQSHPRVGLFLFSSVLSFKLAEPSRNRARTLRSVPACRSDFIPLARPSAVASGVSIHPDTPYVAAIASLWRLVFGPRLCNTGVRIRHRPTPGGAERLSV